MSTNAVSLHAAQPDSADSVESLGALLLAALPPLRLQSVSVFDAAGEVLWLNEGTLGPDEQAFIEEALTALGAARAKAHLENALGDGRGAIFLAVRTPDAALRAVVMVLLEGKVLSSGNLAARILTSNMRGVLQRLALLLQPAAAQAASPAPWLAPAVAASDSGLVTPTISAAADYSALEWSAPQPVPAQELAQANAQARAQEQAQEVVLNLLAEGEPEHIAADRREAQMPGAAALQLRELMRLRSGGRTRRFQVGVENEPQGDPVTTLSRLLGWLDAHPQALESDPVSLTVGIPEQALADPQLPGRLGAAFAAAGVAPEIIGFALQEAACIRQRAAAEGFLRQCEQWGCFALIEDFTFDSAGLALLRFSAVRVLRVDAGLIAGALRDKLAQARIVAIAQAAKVLGMHCAAEQMDSQASRRWLTAVGFDFLLSGGAEPLQRLLRP